MGFLSKISDEHKSGVHIVNKTVCDLARLWSRSPGSTKALREHVWELTNRSVNGYLNGSKLRPAGNTGTSNHKFVFTDGFSFRISHLVVREQTPDSVAVFVNTISKDDRFPQFSRLKSVLNKSAAVLHSSIGLKAHDIEGPNWELDFAARGESGYLGFTLAQGMLTWLKSEQINISCSGHPKVYVATFGPHTPGADIRNPLEFTLTGASHDPSAYKWGAKNLMELVTHVADQCVSIGNFVYAPKPGFVVRFDFSKMHE